jgi:ubiquinone/menaquinone biosynthesis C-methylase UbiE
MDGHDAYAGIARFYDLEFADLGEDVDLYRHYAEIVGSPVLDLGCGTGRLLVPLAGAGFHVTGIDNSMAMLALARDRVAREKIGDRVELLLADVRDLSALPRNHFKLAFCAINSFLHLKERDDHLQALASIRRVVHRDGLLVLDLLHPTLSVLQRMDDQFRHDGSWTMPDGSRIDRFSERRLGTASQLISTTLFYDEVAPNGTVTRTVTEYLTRYIHRFEMESLLAETGFELEGIYGTYQLDPLGDESDLMIVVAHRTADPGEA